MCSLYAWRRRTRRGDIRACGAHSRTSNTDTKLLIYGLFQKGRVLAQDGDSVIREPFDFEVERRTRAQIEEVDWSVGRILDTLRELELAGDTLVLFTSDNGASRGFVNTPLRGGKGSTWEGGMREPTLAWWPGRVSAGTVVDEMATTMDLMPTLAGLAGSQAPAERIIDGKDIPALLLGEEGAQSPQGMSRPLLNLVG